MEYINVGAYVDGKRPKTKKALKDAMASAPATVMFDATSPFNGVPEFNGDGIPAHVTLSVVGPDPYTSRKWYASVKPNGKVS